MAYGVKGKDGLIEEVKILNAFQYTVLCLINGKQKLFPKEQIIYDPSVTEMIAEIKEAAEVRHGDTNSGQ